MSEPEMEMPEEFRSRVAGCAFAWSRTPEQFDEHLAALWRFVREREKAAVERAVTEAIMEERAMHTRLAVQPDRSVYDDE